MMAEVLKVKPAKEGAIIRFPENLARVLSSVGEEVPQTKFWLRRLEGGDVVRIVEKIVEPVKVKKETK
jgi:hypothetical protein